MEKDSTLGTHGNVKQLENFGNISNELLKNVCVRNFFGEVHLEIKIHDGTINHIFAKYVRQYRA